MKKTTIKTIDERFIASAISVCKVIARSQPIRGYSNQETSSELLSEVILYALKRLDHEELSALTKNRARLYGLASLIHKGLIRRASRYRIVGIDELSSEPISDAVETDLSRDIDSAIQKLESKDRAVIKMYQSGLSMSKIAIVFGVSKQAIQQRIATCFIKLQSRLREYGEA